LSEDLFRKLFSEKEAKNNGILPTIKTAAIDISLEMIKIASEFSPKREYINDDFLKHDFHGRIF